VRRGLVGLALAVALVTPALAGDPVELTYPADFDRVWTAAEKALKAEGWGIDDARVQVPREMIRRERILRGERDSGGASADALAQRTLEERMLAAIAREL